MGCAGAQVRDPRTSESRMDGMRMLAPAEILARAGGFPAVIEAAA
jgi:hypothetical protein